MNHQSISPLFSDVLPVQISIYQLAVFVLRIKGTILQITPILTPDFEQHIS